jgi:hypothetical protein
MIMSEFPIEAVGEGEDKSVTLPESKMIVVILERLWMLCSGEKFGGRFYWEPKGEFRYRERQLHDRIFRVRIFEGREDTDRERSDHGGPGRAGLDVLGKYSLSDSMITIYVDSCRRAVSEYSDGNWKLENLIRVVLIHELAHLMTHHGFDLTGNEANHVWEYTAQCATYAYLRTHGEPENLKTFEQITPHQPFIYKTWQVLEAVESVRSKNLIDEAVRSVFNRLTPQPPERGKIGNDTDYDK